MSSHAVDANPAGQGRTLFQSRHRPLHGEPLTPGHAQPYHSRCLSPRDPSVPPSASATAVSNLSITQVTTSVQPQVCSTGPVLPDPHPAPARYPRHIPGNTPTNSRTAAGCLTSLAPVVRVCCTLGRAPPARSLASRHHHLPTCCPPAALLPWCLESRLSTTTGSQPMSRTPAVCRRIGTVDSQPRRPGPRRT